VKPGEQRLLEIPRHRGEDTIMMDLKEIQWEGVKLIHPLLFRCKNAMGYVT
jgi:hypothetical protein